MNANREDLLFQLALTKPADQREAWRDRECGEDTPLHARLEALLEAHDAPEGALTDPREDCGQGRVHLFHACERRTGNQAAITLEY